MSRDRSHLTICSVGSVEKSQSLRSRSPLEIGLGEGFVDALEGLTTATTADVVAHPAVDLSRQ